MRRILFLTLSLMLASSLFLAGCGDDDTTGDEDTTTPTDTNGGDDTSTNPDTTDTNNVECCTAAECAAQGMVCNTTSCECEASAGCNAAGDPCDPSQAQPAAFVCLDDNAGGGECALSCTITNGDSCPSGSFCYVEDGQDAGFCIGSECSGFFGNDCDAGSKCVPIGNDVNLCFPNGVAAENEDCESHADCGAGMICASVCIVPDCAPLTGTPACGTGEECSGFSYGEDDPIDVGVCYAPCTAFKTPSDCATGEVCYPSNERNSSGVILGACEASAGGTLQPGDDCLAQPAGCAGDGICLGTDSDAAGNITAAECVQLCDPQSATSGYGACTTGQSCFGLTSGGVPAEYGYCDVTCDPWAADAASTGCATGEVCYPVERDQATGSIVGICFEGAYGTVNPGESCFADNADCVFGSICIGTEGDAAGNTTEALCFEMCDIESATSGDGACGTNQGCFGLTFTDGSSADYGYCDTVCNYDPSDISGGGVCTAEETCVAGFWYDMNNDFCVTTADFYLPEMTCTDGSGNTHAPPCAELETCSDDGYLCGPGSICIDVPGLTTGAQCLEGCYGACGTSNHPDCSRADAVCSCIGFQDPSLGLCGNE